MAYYDYPNATDSESLTSFLSYINTSAGGLFFPVLILVVWFISFITIFSNEGQGRNAASKAWTFSSFLTSILSIMIVLSGNMAPKFMYLLFLLTGIGLIWMKMEVN